MRVSIILQLNNKEGTDYYSFEIISEQCSIKIKIISVSNIFLHYHFPKTRTNTKGQIKSFNYSSPAIRGCWLYSCHVAKEWIRLAYRTAARQNGWQFGPREVEGHVASGFLIRGHCWEVHVDWLALVGRPASRHRGPRSFAGPVGSRRSRTARCPRERVACHYEPARGTRGWRKLGEKYEKRWAPALQQFKGEVSAEEGRLVEKRDRRWIAPLALRGSTAVTATWHHDRCGSADIDRYASCHVSGRSRTRTGAPPLPRDDVPCASRKL